MIEVQTPALSHPSSLTLGTLFQLSVPQFPYLENGGEESLPP